MIDEKDFIKQIKKVSLPRKHTINNSVGINDFILQYKNDNLSSKQIRNIIKKTNEYISDAIANGHSIYLPHQMGALDIRHYNSFVKFENNELKTNRPIDWNKTLKLWFSDEEAKRNKTFVRTENKKIFRVFYCKAKAKYNNKSFYEFVTNRTLKNKIKNNIKEGTLKDSFNYG